MWSRSECWTPAWLVLVCVFSLTQPTLGQEGGSSSTAIDPRDLSGFWIADTPRNNDPPPLTPSGERLMEGRIPDYLTDVPTESNDPMYECNPQGFPRLVWEENEPIEIIHLDGRILQLFQWERGMRELWMDGRELPSGENLDNLGPAWYGHSVAHWEGNTLVVNTTGLDERAWLDEYGNPVGFDARMEERYTRTGPDTIMGQLTVYDPENYTAPWVQEPVPFTRMRPSEVTFFGWKGLFSGITEAICAPMNETRFDDTIRDPAVFGIE